MRAPLSELPAITADVIERIREKRPRVHCITNAVAQNFTLPNLPFRFSDCDTTVRQVAPDLGQHNAQVAETLGFTATDIATMQADGVLFSA